MSIICEYVIICQNCDISDHTEYRMPHNYRDYLIESGWTDCNGLTMCPLCSKSYNEGINNNNQRV